MAKLPDDAKRHNWARDAKGRLDTFRFHEGNHNGPLCLDCGWTGCHHCHARIYNTECTP